MTAGSVDTDSATRPLDLIERTLFGIAIVETKRAPRALRRSGRGCGRRLKFGGYYCGDVSLAGRVLVCDRCRPELGRTFDRELRWRYVVELAAREVTMGP